MTGLRGAKLGLRNVDPAHPWRRDVVLELSVPGRGTVRLGWEHLEVHRDELALDWHAIGEDHPELWGDLDPAPPEVPEP